MGKALIIKGADFSENKVAKISIPSTVLEPTIRFKEGFWNFLTGQWVDNTGTDNRNSNKYFIKVIPGKQYVISFDATGVYNDIPYYDENKDIQGHWGGTIGSYTTTPIELTIPSGIHYICFNLYTAKNGGDDLTGKIEINGTTEDAYISEVTE